MKNLNELNAQLKLLNNEINSLELNNKNLTNKINNAKKRKTKENFNSQTLNFRFQILNSKSKNHFIRHSELQSRIYETKYAKTICLLELS